MTSKVDKLKRAQSFAAIEQNITSCRAAGDHMRRVVVFYTPTKNSSTEYSCRIDMLNDEMRDATLEFLDETLSIVNEGITSSLEGLADKDSF